MLSTEEQHVLTLVAEVFRDRQAREGHTGAGARRFVHLAIDQGAFRTFTAARLVDAALDHLVIEIVAFTGALTHAGEHGITAVRLRDIVDELHDQHCLADAGAAEQADLAALGVGRQQIDDP